MDDEKAIDYFNDQGHIKQIIKRPGESTVIIFTDFTGFKIDDYNTMSIVPPVQLKLLFLLHHIDPSEKVPLPMSHDEQILFITAIIKERIRRKL